ncbi:CBY1-interacting BAR domain-containing protein 1 [Patella vulgata]|uniref:CBY1-interacting BAR domain-containing protein 1 n=1 Tax=Patella vulgata TaxID=6465 RepID=UPI0021808370|nr:CBY1-interacting BAR domain-containing protein 1 [Patella vulgata]
MLRNTKEFRVTENQTKFSQNRIQHVEKYFGLFCDTLASITRKNARLRDKGDLLSKHLMEYCEAEKANVTTRNSLIKFAENYSAIQDYRDAQINRLDTKVVRPLACYGTICKNMKSIVKTSVASHSKEWKQKQQLDKLKEKAPGDSHQIAQTELERATHDAVHYSHALEAEMEKFEKEKIIELKRTLANFVKIEMAFHARALEYYAKCAENIYAIDESQDLEEFSGRLLATGGFTRQELQGTMMSSTGGYDQTIGTGTYRSGESTFSEERDQDNRPRRQYNRNTDIMYGDLEDDDTEDDDEEANRLR